jgi:hypothetical protein
MDTSEQIPEAGELTPRQLKIGKEYRIVEYGRPSSKVPHKLLRQSLAKFEGRDKIHFHYMNFTIEAPLYRKGEVIVALFNANSPAHNYYNRYFQTAQDRIVSQVEQRALQKVLEQRLDKVSAYGVTDGWLGPSTKKSPSKKSPSKKSPSKKSPSKKSPSKKSPSKKSGGRKHKTRQTKLSRKNRTRKNAS